MTLTPVLDYQVPEGQKPSYAGYPIFTDAQADDLINRAWEHGWQVLPTPTAMRPLTSSSTR